MAIRFQCSSCSQPIEIDDVWSSKLVACPYCQNTVTAPATSTLADLTSTPTARQIVGDFAGDASVPAKRSRLGIVSIVLASLAIVFVISYVSVGAAHIDQLNSFNEKMNELITQDLDFFTASQRASAELFQTSPGGAPPMWIFAIGMLMIGAGMCWLSAVTCALIASRNSTSRKQAFIALGICAMTLVLAFFPG